MLRSPNYSHLRLVEIMLSLGYRSSMQGICRGIAAMSLQACLTGNIERFNERLKFICDHPNLPLAVNELVNKRASRSSLADEEQKIIDVLAFYDGVELYQNAHHHTEHFEKPLSQFNVEAISQITSSQQLENTGNLTNVKSWPGIYHDAELVDYFDFLDAFAREQAQPFSIICSSDNHAVALFYEPKASDWYVINANPFPEVARTPLHLADWIKIAFGESSEFTAFETSIFSTNQDVNELNKIKNAISQSPTFIALHKITKEKAQQKNANQASLAFMATIHGYAEILEELHAAGADLNMMYQGSTLALAAAQNGYVDIFKTLQKCGVDLNKAVDDGTTPALMAAQMGHADVIDVLHAAGVDLNATNAQGSTPVFLAAFMGHANVVRALRAAKADLNKNDNNGMSPAYIAAENDHADVIRALHSGGANLNITNKKGSAPVHAAATYGYASVMRALHESGADLTMTNQFGSTPAFLAAQNGHVNVMQVLLEAGVNLNQALSNGATPIYIASAMGHVKIIELLHAAGADLNIALPNGVTPIYIAAARGQVEAVTALLAANVNFMKPCNDGSTPIEIAEKIGHPAVVEILKKALRQQTQIPSSQESKQDTSGFFQNSNTGSAPLDTKSTVSNKPS